MLPSKASVDLQTNDVDLTQDVVVALGVLQQQRVDLCGVRSVLGLVLRLKKTRMK